MLYISHYYVSINIEMTVKHSIFTFKSRALDHSVFECKCIPRAALPIANCLFPKERTFHK